MATHDAERGQETRAQPVARDDEFLQAQLEISAARAQLAALHGDITERDRRLADLTLALKEREHTIARLQATLPLRLISKTRQIRQDIVESVRRLGRRYISPQTRNRLVRRYPWLRRKRPLHAPAPGAPGAAPLSTAPTTPAGSEAAPGQRLAPYDVICLPAIEWQARPTRPQSLAIEFARSSHRVYYVNPVKMLLASTGKSYASGALSSGVWDIQLAAPRRPLIYREVLDAAIVRTMADGLDQLRRREHVSNAVCVVSFPSWTPLALELRKRFGWTISYDCMDDWQSVEGVQKPALEQEELLVRASALVTAAGPRLQEKWQGHNPRTELLRNGINPEEVARACRPNDLLHDIAHPLVGYIGAITPRLDLEMAQQAAASNPQWQFLFIGNVINSDVSRLRTLPNVRLLDAVTPELIPAYLYHFDACLMPLRRQRMSAADMTRFYEYLSAGKPVVAPPLDDLRPYEAYYYSAQDAGACSAQLGQAIAENDPVMARRRCLFGNANSWSQRYLQLSTSLLSAFPKVSIVIVAYNNVALTQQCVESIFNNTAYPSLEVIVVDNASSDSTHPYLTHAAKVYRNLRLIRNRQNQGFARACNAGLGIAEGEYIVFLNNDVVTPRGWLGRLLRHLDDPQIGLVGPVTNSAGNEAKIATSYQNLDEMEAFAAAHSEEHAGQAFDVAVLALFCAVARRKLFDQIGPLDEQFEIGMFEDDDLAQRVRQAGLRVVCAEDAFVHHVGEAAFKGMPADEYQRIFDANRARFEQKWHTTWQPHLGRELRHSALSTQHS